MAETKREYRSQTVPVHAQHDQAVHIFWKLPDGQVQKELRHLMPAAAGPPASAIDYVGLVQEAERRIKAREGLPDRYHDQARGMAEMMAEFAVEAVNRWRDRRTV